MRMPTSTLSSRLLRPPHRRSWTASRSDAAAPVERRSRSIPVLLPAGYGRDTPLHPSPRRRVPSVTGGILEPHSKAEHDLDAPAAAGPAEHPAAGDPRPPQGAAVA